MVGKFKIKLKAAELYSNNCFIKSADETADDNIYCSK